MMFRLAIAVGLVAYTAAQNVSTQCAASLAPLLSDPGAGPCLALPDLVQVLSGASLDQSLNTWISSLCSAPACNDATLAVVAGDLASGSCSSLLTALGLPTDASTLTSILETAYPVIRNIACLEDTTTGAFCLTESITNIETVTGPVTLQDLVGFFQSPPAPGTLPANIICTNCIQEIYNIFSKYASASFISSLQSQCPSFASSAVPPDVTESANTAIVSGS